MLWGYMTLLSTVPNTPQHEERISLRAYLCGRRYRSGRGRADAWAFLAEAVGDASFPNARSWRELLAYLDGTGRDAETVEAAKVLWRSYLRNAPLEMRR
jgi:hypothetical protein